MPFRKYIINLNNRKTMKKGCFGLSGCVVLIIAALIVLALWAVPSYNGLVKDQESVEKAWGNVENQYQRRADLIPNLVETVKGYAKHEQETLEGVIEARANATKVTIDPTNMTPEDLQKYQAAQGDVTNALSRLIAVSESYPDLKANENFKDLQQQLESTENRINKARDDFNEIAQKYDTKRRTFPTNIIATIFNFEEKPYFKSQDGADKAPKVDFGTSESK